PPNEIILREHQILAPPYNYNGNRITDVRGLPNPLAFDPRVEEGIEVRLFNLNVVAHVSIFVAPVEQRRQVPLGITAAGKRGYFRSIRTDGIRVGPSETCRRPYGLALRDGLCRLWVSVVEQGLAVIFVIWGRLRLWQRCDGNPRSWLWLRLRL